MAAALSLGLSLSAVPASAAPATPSSVAAAGELVLPAAPRAVPRATQILNAGASGFLWAQEGDDRLLWTSYATGATTALEQRLPAPVEYDIDSGYFHEAASFHPGWYGDGSDTVALYSQEDSQVTLLKGDGTSGGAVVVPVPEGHTYQGTFGAASSPTGPTSAGTTPGRAPAGPWTASAAPSPTPTTSSASTSCRPASPPPR
ncbi:hypothetical protein [Streptomyces sp. B21-083]|uniref:hypothetical protein n=1 Tax=Streptomyces sp. B21-083 TaxID=3039410 RepID=UPI002FF11439